MALVESMGAARRRRPYEPSAIQERNVVGLLYTKKIKIIFFGLAAAAAKERYQIVGTPSNLPFYPIQSVLLEPRDLCLADSYL